MFPRDQRQFEVHLQRIKEKDEQDELLLGAKEKEEKSDAIFIVKPEAACQGKGIFLIRYLTDI